MEMQLSPSQAMSSHSDEGDASFQLPAENADGSLSCLGTVIIPQRQRRFGLRPVVEVEPSRRARSTLTPCQIPQTFFSESQRTPDSRFNTMDPSLGNNISSSKPNLLIPPSPKFGCNDPQAPHNSKISPQETNYMNPTRNTPTICPNPPTLSKSIGSPETSISVDSWRYIAESELSDPDLAYPRVLNPNNRSNPRGVCLLINQRDFDQAKTGQERRDGTDIDADIVERTFIKCGYAVNRATNLTLRKMEYLLDDVRNQNHSKYDSFVCVILSHGCEGMVFASDGTINVDRLISYFRSDRCPTLAGKPKMFFIQACRGSKFDRGFAFSTDASSERMLITKMPIEADVFVANSTFPGYYAWRNSHAGSWFIQELCKVIKAGQDLGKSHDVAALLTVVARKVAILYESNTGQADSHASKQMVSINSTLTRKAYLF